MLKYIITLVICFASYSAFYSFQQDWRDGPGVPGPETNWGDSFHQSSNLQWWALDPATNYHPMLELEHFYHFSVDTTGPPCSSLTPGDIDGDSDNDLIGCSGSLDQVNWWENTSGDGTVWETHSVATDFNGAISVGTSDMNGDGSTDIVAAAKLDDEIAWWENQNGTGTQWAKHTVTDSFTGVVRIIPVDVDGDGDTDIIASAMNSPDILWFENTNSQGTSWQEHTIAQAAGAIKTFKTGDMDNDGDTDVVGFHGSWNLVLWENTSGTGTSWAENTICSTISSISDVALGDLNEDGYQDVVTVKEQGYSRVACFISNGYGGFSAPTVIENYIWGASRVDLYDQDDDGDMDILASSSFYRFVKYWENMDGTGTEWNRFCVQGEVHGLADVCAADIDGDGIEDAAAAGDNEAVIWWKDSTYKATGWLESTIEINPSTDIAYTELTSGMTVPPGTSVEIQLRSSNNYSDMGEWSDPLPVPCDISDMFPQTHYLQYRVTLSTTDPNETPRINNIFVHYDELGIGGEGSTLNLTGPLTNPVAGEPVVSFHTPEAVEAAFTLFDLTGRTAAEVPLGEYSQGSHTVTLPRVPAGTYILQMSTEGTTRHCRMVVIPQ